MQYMLLIYEQQSLLGNMKAEDVQAVMARYISLTQEMHKAGIMRAGSELQPIANATTVRVRNGKALTTDGPFAETKEQLGGYYLIDVPTLDEAMKWAARIPSSAWGSIEIRPINEHPMPQ